MPGYHQLVTNFVMAIGGLALMALLGLAGLGGLAGLRFLARV
jgi:hypothetical protein